MMNKIAMTTAIVASMGVATALGVALGDTINNDAQASIAPATNKAQESEGNVVQTVIYSGM